MAAKQRVYEHIATSADGKRIEGYRVIEGSRSLDQYVVFNDLCLADFKSYAPDERDGRMITIAEQLLFELASGRTINAVHPSKYKINF